MVSLEVNYYLTLNGDIANKLDSSSSSADLDNII